MTPRVRLALVGAGAWGLNYVRAAEEAGNARVERVLSRFSGPSERWFEDVDAVVVATPPQVSVNVAGLALLRGLPVLVEKPAGLSLADAERLAHVERETGGMVLVGHQHLFSTGVERLRREAEKHLRVEGEVCFGGPGPVRDYPALWDYGPHAVSIAVSLLGDNVSTTRESHGTFIVVGDRGWLRCRVGNDWREKHAKVVCPSLGTYDGHGPQEPPLTRQVREFARVVQALQKTKGDGWAAAPWQFGARWAVSVARLLEQAGGGPGYSSGGKKCT